MIYIDFQAGSHGNYLEFVCNKFLAGVDCNNLPFNMLGASHQKGYLGEEKFQANHYFEFRGKKTSLTNSKIISIQITHDDLLPLSSISLLRAGDYNIDNDELEIDTYHKLNNEDYKWVLKNLIDKFFQTQIQQSYNSVKDESWPPVQSLQDFENLPDWIKLECSQQHNLKLVELTENRPDCARYILREFFKIGFKHPEQSGFVSQQKKMIYDVSNDVYVFPFSSFYTVNNFLDQIACIAKWADFELTDLQELLKVHDQFLEKQPYKNSKIFCDTLIKKILQNETFDFPKLDLFQESYIAAQLEKYYNCELLIGQNDWYKNSKEIFDIVK